MIWLLLALVGSYLLGALPLGSLLIKRVTGFTPREMSAHNLGVENLMHFVGRPLALASFGLDLLKGFVALALFAGSPWAAVGVYLGHLYPLPLKELPRGRGNGVLLGVLAGLWAFGGLSWLAAAVPVVVYAGVLALSGYVALATLAGLAALVVATVVTGPTALAVATLLIATLALWRHKASLMRLLDQTEPKLGESLPVRARDPGVVTAAFMIHPLSLDDLWQPGSQRWLRPLYQRGLLSEATIRKLTPHFRPLKQGEIKGVRLADGRELRLMLLTGPLLPDQIRYQPEVATRMASQGARLAYELGAEAFGLGAFWSTVGNKGLDVQEAVPEIHITNGGAYTAATVKAAVPGLLASFEAEGGSLKRACAAVVGANGVVAFGVARMIAGEVAELILIGRDLERLNRSAETLRRKFPQTVVTTSTEVAACAAADLVFTATSDPAPVLFAEHVKPGAWLFDLGRPADVDDSVRRVPGVHIVPGGVVRPPGAMQSLIDLHFGDGLVPACLAETMIMTATRAFDRKSLGPQTKTADIDFYLEAGARLGFEIVTRDEQVAPLELAR
ncbi:MAG: glycerol-3-phosphate acyltransferase [Truepera sp.]|nr:glycerol-3-phosphate acyltransferase [Truepera sp.]